MLILTVFTNLLEPITTRSAATTSGSATATRSSGPGTGRPIISAFRKLARLNKDDPDPHWLETVLFHSHPPIGQRLAMAEAFKSPDDG